MVCVPVYKLAPGCGLCGVCVLETRLGLVRSILMIFTDGRGNISTMMTVLWLAGILHGILLVHSQGKF